MRRLSAILFLSVLLFNLCGYRLLISHLQQSSATSLEARLDKQDYSDDELISVKTTLNLPYYLSSPTYERAYGSVTINGEEYDYVKRRAYHDTLELLCLPNHEKTKLRTAGNEFAKSSADGPSLPSKKSTNIQPNLPDLFHPEHTFALSVMTGAKNDYNLANVHPHANTYADQPDRPPRLLAPCMAATAA